MPIAVALQCVRCVRVATHMVLHNSTSFSVVKKKKKKKNLQEEEDQEISVVELEESSSTAVEVI